MRSASRNPMKLILAIAAVVICVASGCITSVEDDAHHADTESQQMSAESAASESSTVESTAKESSAVESSAQESTAGENIAQESSAIESAVQESTPQASNHKFRSKKLLNQHYEKHGIEMGFASAAEYEAAASAVIDNPDALYKTEQEDGDGVYYVESTNEFVILSTDGYIRTYFYPSGGISYFNRQ